MLPRQPLRYVLADDPGAGKTIMAGLFIRELLMRADAQRVLIVAPGSLIEQWQEEMFEKFGLDFTRSHASWSSNRAVAILLRTSICWWHASTNWPVMRTCKPNYVLVLSSLLRSRWRRALCAFVHHNSVPPGKT